MIESSFQLIVRTGPIPGQVFALEKGEVFIGREMSNDIVINDAEISRRHARITWQPNGFLIEDLGSTNGTFINGQRLMNPALLRPGDIMMFGEHVTMNFEEVRFDESQVTPPAQPVAPAPSPVPQPVPQPVFPPEVAPQPVKPQPAPVYTPPPAPVYAAPIADEPKPVKPKSKVPVWLIILLVVLVLGCLCLVAVLWFIDANRLWCQVMPFIPGCETVDYLLP